MSAGGGQVLKRKFPNGVDLVIEHVGGKLLETAINNCKRGGKVIIVGYISQVFFTLRCWDGDVNGLTTYLSCGMLVSPQPGEPAGRGFVGSVQAHVEGNMRRPVLVS